MARIVSMVLVLGALMAASAWGTQMLGPRDGIDLKNPKEGCPCPPTHAPDCPQDGIWCPPWWPCPIETGFLDPAPSAPLPLSVTASWFMPRSKLSNLGLVSLTGIPGGGSRTSPLRFLGAFGGGGGGERVSGASSAPLIGPEIECPLPPGAVSWMPFEADVQIYARVLVGDMEIDGESTAVQDYALGVRLAVPVWRPPDFTLSPYVSVGPAFLRTEFGHATGVDAAIGLRGDYRISRSLALIIQIELDTFSSSDFFSWGPAGTAGLTIGF